LRVRLAEFITANIEPILIEWESFARSIWPSGVLADPVELRDSAEQILRAVVADMCSGQSLHERSEKSMGRGAGGAESDRLDHASQVHGAARVGSGMVLTAVVSEYRALRASVLWQWRASNRSPDQHDLDDITRFNEAIDQSLALAVAGFTRGIDASRNMFLGILGHDLRNPLSAITLTTRLAMAAPDPRELPQQLAQINASAEAIAHLVTDLIDFTSSTLGVRLPLTPAPSDLHVLCDEVVRETRAARASSGGCVIRVAASGDLKGTWDAHRLRQLISNLLGNAIQHGCPNDPVDLKADGADADTVVITVHNTGQPIPAHLLATIFDPLTRGHTSVQQRRTPGSIGLGLYIVREIATAHGGTAELASFAVQGTTATVRLPRRAHKSADRTAFVR
jgi:signal transduction histidine kinase